MSVFDIEARLLTEAKSPDTPENFSRAATRIAEIAIPEARLHFRHYVPKVAFYLPTPYLFAHAANLATLFRGLDKIGNPIDSCVVTHGSASEEFRAAFSGRVCEIPAPYTQAWIATQQLGKAHHWDAFVHVSTIQGMAFASAMRCARKHIWLSYKWHCEIPGIDGYINGTGSHQPAPWKNVYTALPDLTRPGIAEHAAEIRKNITAKTIFGTVGREEKITDGFITAVNRILAEVPDSIFVYTGRKEVPFNNPKVQWAGWCDPEDTYTLINVLDVYLDTWPFHSGHTAWQAIAAKKPIVMMDQPDTDTQAWVPLLMKRNSWAPLVAKGIDQYVTIAKHIEWDFTTYISYNHDFYIEHMRDEARMAKEFVEALKGFI